MIIAFFLMIFCIWGYEHEDKFVAFENRLFGGDSDEQNIA